MNKTENRSNQIKVCKITDLPQDTTYIVLEYLTIRDVFKLFFVSKEFNESIYNALKSRLIKLDKVINKKMESDYGKRIQDIWGKTFFPFVCPEENPSIILKILNNSYNPFGFLRKKSGNDKEPYKALSSLYSFVETTSNESRILYKFENGNNQENIFHYFNQIEKNIKEVEEDPKKNEESIKKLDDFKKLMILFFRQFEREYSNNQNKIINFDMFSEIVIYFIKNFLDFSLVLSFFLFAGASVPFILTLALKYKIIICASFGGSLFVFRMFWLFLSDVFNMSFYAIKRVVLKNFIKKEKLKKNQENKNFYFCNFNLINLNRHSLTKLKSYGLIDLNIDNFNDNQIKELSLNEVKTGLENEKIKKELNKYLFQIRSPLNWIDRIIKTLFFSVTLVFCMLFSMYFIGIFYKLFLFYFEKGKQYLFVKSAWSSEFKVVIAKLNNFFTSSIVMRRTSIFYNFLKKQLHYKDFFIYFCIGFLFNPFYTFFLFIFSIYYFMIAVNMLDMRLIDALLKYTH